MVKCKNSSFKVENFKIFLAPLHPRSGCGEAGKGLLGKKIGRGKNPVGWLKTLSNCVKTHLLKLKTSKFSLGATPPPLHPPQWLWGSR